MSGNLQRTILERAEAYLRSGFSQGSEARDRYGQRERWDSKRAVSFCAKGAIKRATRDVLGSFGRKGSKLAVRLIDDCGVDGDAIAFVNDSWGLDAVIAQFHQTIKRLS